jgi:hypothetical protein
MKEYLGATYVFSLKPSPTPLASKTMDENLARKEIAEKLDESMGCNIEVIMKDNHTLDTNHYNAIRCCKIAREEIDKRY